MDDVLGLLSSMYRTGVKLWVENGHLHYHAPAGLTAEQVGSLRSQKSAVMAVLATSENAARNPSKVFPRQSADLMPLSIQQEQFWNALQKSRTFNYLETFALRLRGALNVDWLHRSLNALVRRHEALRTRIVVTDGVPKQKIDAPSAIDFPVIDCCRDCRSSAEHEARRYVERFVQRFVDLEKGPLFEATLIKVAEHDYVLAVSIHHIMIDAGSEFLLFRQLWTLYRDFARGRSPSLAELPMQYADYAVWQRQVHLHWQMQHETYWRKRLCDAIPTRLPSHDRREDVKRELVELDISLSEPLVSALCDLARRERTTPAMIVLSIYAAALARWCNQMDFVIPFGGTGRYCSAHEDMIGLFASGLLLRIVLSGSETLLDLVELVSREFLTALAHPDSGKLMGKIMEEKPELARGPGVLIYPWERSDFAATCTPPDWDEWCRGLIIDTFPAKHPEVTDIEDAGIELFFITTRQGLCAQMFYRADLFSSQTMERLSHDLRKIAEQIVGDPAGTRVRSASANEAAQIAVATS